MTLTKNKMVREIGRRTRLNNRDVQLMLEKLTEIWIEELVNGGRIELEHFFVLEVREIERAEDSGTLSSNHVSKPAPRSVRQVLLRPSRLLRKRING